MTAQALAWRTVTAKPSRAVLAVTGVTVIGALLFNMLLLSHGLLLSFRDLLDTAGYDVRVVATDGLPFLRVPLEHAAALATELRTLPEIAEVVFIRSEGAVALPPSRGQAGITLMGASAGAERRVWRIVAGRNLSEGAATGEPPLVVNRRLADQLKVAPGSTLRVRVSLGSGPSALPAVIFRIVGIAEFQLELPEDLMASTTIEALDRARARDVSDDADVVLVASRPSYGVAAAVAAITQRRPDLRAYSNEQIVEQFNLNGFAYFRQISLVLSSITLGFAFLLVATLLSVSVNQRLHEVAALRALGVRRRRIAATLLWESAWLVGAGGLLSLPVGGALAAAFDRILRTMPGLPDRLHFFVFEPRAIAIHLALLVATSIGAAVYPVWIATRLPIASTLRQETL